MSLSSVRRVNRTGYVKIDGAALYSSQALAGVSVGVADVNELYYAVYFGCIELGLIDADTYASKPFSQKQIPPKMVEGEVSSEP